MKVRITLVKSLIGRKPYQRKTARALGLRRIGSTVEQDASAPIMGMVRAINHLIRVEELQAAKQSKPAAAAGRKAEKPAAPKAEAALKEPAVKKAPAAQKAAAPAAKKAPAAQKAAAPAAKKAPAAQKAASPAAKKAAAPAGKKESAVKPEPAQDAGQKGSEEK
jgi:ribosomal protein L30